MEVYEDLVFGSQPGFLTLSSCKSEQLIAQQPLEQNYAVDNQPFARGKFAAVKRCRHLQSGREYAAKVIRKRRRGCGLSAETLHEAAVLDLCRSCPHIVRLEQVYDASTESVLLLELAEGGELQSILDRDEIPEEKDVIRFLRQVLSGLAFLHQRNIAHLDLKPQNLLLTGAFPDCDIKLCDFGIARHIARGADVREILGTPDYVAPEVLNYEPISLATDMWSVGVLAYVLLTGCTPFGGDSKQETFCNITRCQLDFPEDLFGSVSPGAIHFISRLLVKDPSERLTAQQSLEHPWLSLGSSLDLIPPEMCISDSGVSSSSTIVPDEEDLLDSLDALESSSQASDTTDTAENKDEDTSTSTSSSPTTKILDDDLVVHLSGLSLQRRATSLPIRWRTRPRRDSPFDRASDQGYGSDGISEVSSIESSSDRSSIISLDDSPSESGHPVLRRYSDTSLFGERLWRRAWERLLPSSRVFVNPPQHFFRQGSEGPKQQQQQQLHQVDRKQTTSQKPWEKICVGSRARAMEKLQSPTSSPQAATSTTTTATAATVLAKTYSRSTLCLRGTEGKTATPKVSEVRNKLLQTTPTKNLAKTPIRHLDRGETVTSILSKFHAAASP